MGFWKDIGCEWTWEGMKADWKERWVDFLAVFVAGFLTPSVMKWLGWEDGFLAFSVIFIVIAVVTGTAIGLAAGIFKKTRQAKSL